VYFSRRTRGTVAVAVSAADHRLLHSRKPLCECCVATRCRQPAWCVTVREVIELGDASCEKGLMGASSCGTIMLTVWNLSAGIAIGANCAGSTVLDPLFGRTPQSASHTNVTSAATRQAQETSRPDLSWQDSPSGTKIIVFHGPRVFWTRLLVV
jgi:hypothetical protein